MFRPATSPPTLFTLVYLTALSVVALNMFMPSLPGIAAEFDVSYTTAGFAVSGFLALTAVLQIIFGPLSDRYGRRPVLLWGLVVFVAASVGCAITTSFALFLTCRVLQGAVIAAMALSRAVVRDTHKPQDAAAKLGMIGMAMAIAPMLGPAAGGLLDELFGWRASFVAYTGLGLFALWLVWADLGETNTTRHANFRDQFRTYPELFRSRRFWGYSAGLAFSIGAFYGYLAGVPALAAGLGLPPSITGLAMGAPTFGFFFGNWATGRLGRRVPILTIAIAGRMFTAIGVSVSLVLLGIGVSPMIAMVVGAISVGFGNGLTIPTANAGIMSVRPHLAGSASGLSGAMTVAVGALMSSLVAAAMPATGGNGTLLAILLATGLAALVSILYVARVDRIDPL